MGTGLHSSFGVVSDVGLTIPMGVVARSVDELSSTFSCEIGDSAIKTTGHREARYDAEVDLFVLVMHVRSGDDPLLGTVSGRTAGLDHLVVQLDKSDTH